MNQIQVMFTRTNTVIIHIQEIIPSTFAFYVNILEILTYNQVNSHTLKCRLHVTCCK